MLYIIIICFQLLNFDTNFHLYNYDIDNKNMLRLIRIHVFCSFH